MSLFRYDYPLMRGRDLGRGIPRIVEDLGVSLRERAKTKIELKSKREK